MKRDSFKAIYLITFLILSLNGCNVNHHHHHYDFLNNSHIQVLIQSVHSRKYLYAHDWNVTQNHKGTLFNLVLVNAHERIYEIKRVSDGKVLDIEGGSCEQGAKLIIYPRHGGKNQQFKIEQVDGFFIFKPMNSIHRNFVLDVEGISCKNGAKIHQWGFHGGKNQLFRIIPKY